MPPPLNQEVQLLSPNDIISYIDFATYLDYFMNPKLLYCSISKPVIINLTYIKNTNNYIHPSADSEIAGSYIS